MTTISGSLSSLLTSPTVVRSAVGLALGAAAIAFTRHTVFLLGPDEQLVVEELQRRSVIQGPAVATVLPWPLRRGAEKRPALKLEAGEYVCLTDMLSGEQTIKVGPQLLFLGPYEEVLEGEVFKAISLSATEYVKLQDMLSGEIRVVKGPTSLVPAPKDAVMEGPAPAITLKGNEYIRLIDTKTGAIRVQRGEALVWPGPTEQPLPSDKGKMTALKLKQHEYARLVDEATGKQRVARGPQLVWLGATESFANGSAEAMPALEVDEDSAILVRDKSSGQLRLEQSKQLYFPSALEEIVEVQPRVRLAEYEAVILKDPQGAHTFLAGSAIAGCKQQGSFFVPPHHSLVELRWSEGRRREQRTLRLTVVDLRPMYMSFEFKCRTADNVELILEGTFFWQITDMPQMLRTTRDTTGDICKHARSEVLQLVSQVTLKEFMTDFQKIAEQSHKKDDSFYRERGVTINLMEITHYACANRQDQEVLQQIIQETTHRMNRLQKQESENEVALRKLSGQVKEETARGELLELKQQLSRKEAQTLGEAEASCLQAFLAGLKEDVPTMEERLALWRLLRKNDALESLANGKASLYFTPQDVNLTIHDR